MATLERLLLLGDGASDRALRRPIEWALRQMLPDLTAPPVEFLPRRPPGRALPSAIAEIVLAYRPDILFVHRDAEKASREERVQEVPVDERIVPVIPVRMTEAWFLISEEAIRRASGNPRGNVRLDLPALGALERLADPKGCLRELLIEASEATGRRRRQLERDATLERVADSLESYANLRRLPAFVAFESDLRAALVKIGQLEGA